MRRDWGRGDGGTESGSTHYALFFFFTSCLGYGVMKDTADFIFCYIYLPEQYTLTWGSGIDIIIKKVRVASNESMI